MAGLPEQQHDSQFNCHTDEKLSGEAVQLQRYGFKELRLMYV